METKIKKDFDAVKFMRKQRDKMSQKLINMSKEEVIEYYKEKREKGGIKPSA
jgi:hypothetical protein